MVHASRAIDTGDQSLVLAGGVESMTRAPWVLPKPDRGFPGNPIKPSGRRLWAGAWSTPEWTSVGQFPTVRAAEILAERFSISRQAQDEFATRSHRLAHQAWELGIFDSEVVGLNGADLSHDEGIRAETTPGDARGVEDRVSHRRRHGDSG